MTKNSDKEFEKQQEKIVTYYFMGNPIKLSTDIFQQKICRPEESGKVWKVCMYK